jgi:hypothetical protein
VSRRRLNRSGWFPLSPEARGLIRAGGWEYVELMDGPAAQALILGVRAKPPPPDLFTALEPEPDSDTPDPAQTEMDL